jgi:hypothetical protein
MGSDHGSLKDEELMAECEVLEGDSRRPKEPGAQEGPETDHDNHCGTRASGVASEPRPLQDQRWTRRGKFRWDKVDGVLDRDRRELGRLE